MFDEIFNRWIETNSLTSDDIIPIFLEWNQVFGDGKATAQDIMLITNIIHCDYGRILCYALETLGKKKGYNWITVYSKEGNILKRFIYNETIPSKEISN